MVSDNTFMVIPLYFFSQGTCIKLQYFLHNNRAIFSSTHVAHNHVFLGSYSRSLKMLITMGKIQEKLEWVQFAHVQVQRMNHRVGL